MTIRLVFVLVMGLLSTGFFTAAVATQDAQKRQTRLLFAIYFALWGMDKVIDAIAIHTGAYPLWNNR